MRSLLTTLKESAQRLVSHLLPGLLRSPGEQHEAAETSSRGDAGCDCTEPGACGRTCAAGDSGAVARHMKHSEILKAARKRLALWESDEINVAVIVCSRGGNLQQASELLQWIKKMMGGVPVDTWLRKNYPDALEVELRLAKIDYLDRLIEYLESLGK
ncbi:MAG: hypothetical protein KGI52_10515 [Burkholderiales bacterium]|nr:hypothetical protein [Burkholderiales bacterium]